MKRFYIPYVEDEEIADDGPYCHAEDALKIIAVREARIAELEAAIDKLAQCKGRFHTEVNFKELLAVREKGQTK